MMMIFGFIITAGTVGHYLDPFTPERLVLLTSAVAALAFCLTVAAVRGIEVVASATDGPATAHHGASAALTFRASLAEVWADTKARRFTVFVFMSMLAYSAQDLILEPFAGTVFGYTPGESTKLAGVQNAGVLLGMLMVALATTRGAGARRFGSLSAWTIGGCIASALSLAALVGSGLIGPGWPLRATVFCLGVSNGAFAVAAIGSMMALAGDGPPAREGIRMGLWGASQAIAFGAGGFTGAMLSDLIRSATGSVVAGYTTVLAIEAVVFIIAAVLAARIGITSASPLDAGRQNAGAGGRAMPDRLATESNGRRVGDPMQSSTIEA
jgi:BCD family chlorophyll transporter-like MFS transporter